MLNRNKVWKKLDLKDKNQRQIFYDLVTSADIVIENFSPQVKYKLGIDYETLRKINPWIIYGSLSGYWEAENKKSYDAIIQAESGFMSLNGIDAPTKNATSVIDTLSWNSLALAISSALYYREKTGKGQYVEVSMMANAFQLLESELTATSISWKNPQLSWNHDNMIFPFGVFATKDSQIMLAIWNDKLWENFCGFIWLEPDQIFGTNMKRLDQKDTLIEKIESIFQSYTTEQLSQMLQKAGIPCSEINTMKDILSNQQYFERNYIKTIDDPILWKVVVPFEYISLQHWKINYSPFEDEQD